MTDVLAREAAGLPTIYLARMDVDPEYRDRFVDWYRNKHAPDLIHAGFYSCSEFHAEIGGPWDCNIYEIPGPDLFQTEPYRLARTAERDPQRPEVLDHVHGRSNTPYAQVLVDPPAGNVDWTRGDRGCAVDAEYVTNLYFDHDAEHGQTLAWATAAEMPRLRATKGYRRSRLCRRSGSHLNPSSQPDWLFLVEWGSRDAAQVEAMTEPIARLRRSTGGRTRNESFDLLMRAFTLRDRPAS